MTRQTLRYYWQACKHEPRMLWGTLLLLPVGSALQDLVAPLIAAQAINRLVEVNQSGLAGQSAWDIFLPYILALLACAAIGQRAFAWALQCLTHLQTRVRRRLDDTVYHALLKQSQRFHDDAFGGALVNDSSKFAQAFIGLTDVLVIQCVQLFIKFIIALVIIAVFTWPIALVLFGWTLIFMATTVWLARRRSPLAHSAAEADSQVTAHLADSVSNIAVVQAFGGDTHEYGLYGGLIDHRAATRDRLWITGVFHASITAWQIIVVQCAVLILSIYFVLHGNLQLGTLLLIQVYIAQLIAQLRNFAVMTRNLEQYISDAANMTRILKLKPTVRDPAAPRRFRPRDSSIDLNAVSFAYTDEAGAEHLFRDLDLHIPAGQRVGLVGHSGAGKTTLTKLLLRFMDITAGQITVGGQDIRQVRQRQLRRQLAYVPQEPLLFHRSIADNIAYGDPGASRAAIERAARRAYADGFIGELSNGYDTLVGERGVKLSGGQRQRIAIARAILKDAPILLLDEATSALDSESERVIQRALEKLMGGRTSIVIAHRLSTIQKLDRIIVLEQGRIVEDGTHQQLLAAKGTYAGLWDRQSGGFIED